MGTELVRVSEVITPDVIVEQPTLPVLVKRNHLGSPLTRPRHWRLVEVGRIEGGTGKVGKLALPSRSTAWTAKNRSSLESPLTIASTVSVGLSPRKSSPRVQNG